MGYGADSYGLSSYGLGSASLSGAFGLSVAEAIATRIVQVTLTAEPTHVAATGSGDALNPATWSVSRQDTGQQFTVAQVVQLSALVYNIQLLQPMGPQAASHIVSCNSLLNLAGTAFVSQSLSFGGAIAFDSSTAERTAGSKRYSSIDIANPPTALLNSGTLLITAAGDYDTVTGPDLVRKLIFRELATTPGAFFWMPDYGLGLGEKEPMSGASLKQLKAEIERRVKRMPEVADVSASLQQDSSGTLLLQLAVKVKPTGQQIAVSYPPPLDDPSFRGR